MDIEPDENAGEEPDCLTCSQVGIPQGCPECGREGPGYDAATVWREVANMVDPWAESPF